MERFSTFIADFSSWLWAWPMIILLLGTHIFLTFRLKIPQRKVFKGIRLSIIRDEGSKGDVSQFAALATALAGTIGTGNIIGVATAVTIGGPGAVFWCWVTGLFGIATKYAEGLLAIKFRVKKENGEMLGGPMYALERGLHMKWLAVLFCIFTAIAAFGIGSTVQSNSISIMLQDIYGLSPHLTGGVLAVLVALVILFGVKGIANVCGWLVPFMAVFYVVGCLYILYLNADYLGETVRLIGKAAFTPMAAGGGFTGATVMMAARYGIARGLFSNESGLGSAPIIAAAAQTRNPVRQALVSSTGTFWDTVVICAITGLVLVSSILAHPEIDYTQGASLTKAAFSKIPYVGDLVLSVGIVTFAFTTILGWTYYSGKAVEYLGGLRYQKTFFVIHVIMVYVGSVVNISIVWNLADIMNGFMAIPNLISLILLSKLVADDTDKYLWSDRLEEEGD
ncbi:MAG: alanine/glycine:cation symporter family protein [Parabacteroides sp.]